MADKELKCLSCGKRISNISGTVKFQCPSCGKYEMIRCKPCRVQARKYKCPECGFEGPN